MAFPTGRHHFHSAKDRIGPFCAEDFVRNWNLAAKVALYPSGDGHFPGMLAGSSCHEDGNRGKLFPHGFIKSFVVLGPRL